MRRALWLLLALLRVGCVMTFGDGDPLAASHPGAAGGVRVAAQSTAHREVVCMEVYFNEGPSQRIPAGCTPVAPTPAPNPTSTPTATDTPVPTSTIAPTPTPQPTPTRQTIFTPLPVTAIPKCEVHAGAGVKYYPRPEIASGALGYLGTGITYVPTAILVADNNIWAFIPGKGYAAAGLNFPIFDNEACRDLLPPAVTPVPTSPAPSPTPIQPIYACTTGQDYLNIRLGPGTSYTIVGRLEPGIRLRIVTKLDTGWWEVWYGSLPGQYIAGWLAKEC